MRAKEVSASVVCPGCGVAFVCGVTAGLATCWCMEKPIGLPITEADGRCYCAACLAQRVSAAGRSLAPEA